jgi:protein-disulfide isomerase
MEVVRLKNAVTERDHASGPATAPVTLLEYGNFECIDCGRAFPVIKEVQELLGDNLRFVFRHFPTEQTHPHALRAAEAAEAAAAQGKFWEMHDELFAHQRFLEDQHLSKYARRIGLDTERFNVDLMENSFLARIQDDFNRALYDEHITGTPTLYINEVRYTRATDRDSILAKIREADTEGRIHLPEESHGLKRILDRFHTRGGG